jgi:hypothetical protein
MWNDDRPLSNLQTVPSRVHVDPRWSPPLVRVRPQRRRATPRTAGLLDIVRLCCALRPQRRALPRRRENVPGRYGRLPHGAKLHVRALSAGSPITVGLERRERRIWSRVRNRSKPNPAAVPAHRRMHRSSDAGAQHAMRRRQVVVWPTLRRHWRRPVRVEDDELSSLTIRASSVQFVHASSHRPKLRVTRPSRPPRRRSDQDDDLGGIVDDIEINPDGGTPDAIRDERMTTCMRESLSSLAFRPPPNDGWVTIVHPLLFSDGDQPRSASPGGGPTRARGGRSPGRL